MKNMANGNLVLVTDNATAKAELVTPPSPICMVGGSGGYFGPITVKVTGATQGAIVQTAPMTGDIIPTGVLVTLSGIPCVLEGDKTQEPIKCPAVTPPPASAPTVIPVTVIIASAGQVFVQGA